MMSAHSALRDATASSHERVDAAFSSYDLGDAAGYAAFLQAHAEAFLPIEAALDAAGVERLIDDWPARRRSGAIRQDLAQLGEAVPNTSSPTPMAIAGDGQIAGALYVLEGSRLGGRFLARRVPDGFPRAYLDADQAPGNWRKLLDRLDLILYDAEAMKSAIGAAQEAFAAFERSGERWLKG
ncbi:MAG: biliverdin-producing heme oxygenase [Sphingomonas sp.]|jgi:heme oxygenase